jgi:SecY interacting protein Syd
MKLTNDQLSELLWQFSQEYVTAFQNTHQHFPVAELDEQWPSPCQLDVFKKEYIEWQPIKISNELSFDNLESALELDLHQDIKCYFTSIFSDSVHASHEEGELSLLFPWSEEDFARLQQNIIAHVLMKRQLKQTITIFFAVTDDDELLLSVNNDSGEVWVERVGCEPHKKLADSLSEFIQTLTPSIDIED